VLVTRKCAGPESGTCTSCGYCDAACLSLLGYSAYAPHGSLSRIASCENGTEVPTQSPNASEPLGGVYHDSMSLDSWLDNG
jgi:hypothetical protein